MKIDPSFYITWTSWYAKTVCTAIDNDEDGTAKALVEGGRRVFNAVFEPFQTFPEIKGSALQIGYSLYLWAKENKDPLKRARDIMERLRKDYGKS